MGFRVWVLYIQNPKNRIFFRKILNSNLNNLFVLTDRRTFYVQNVDIVNTFPIKKTLCRWGVGFGFYGQPKSEKSGKTKPDFFIYSESQIF